MTASDFKKIALFEVLTPAEQSAVTRHLAVQTVPPKTVLIGENDNRNEVYFILDGRVAIKSFSDMGHEVAYAELSQGGFFGEFAALDGRPRSATVETVAQTRLASMDAAQFRSCLLQYPAMTVELSRQLVGKIRHMTERIFEFSTLPVANRVRLELLRLARFAPVQDDRCVLHPAPSHQAIAAHIATHREAVSREMSALAKTGVVRTAHRTITIQSIEKLRHLAGLPPEKS